MTRRRPSRETSSAGERERQGLRRPTALTLSPSGAFLLVPDRPADIVRSYAVDPDDGSLSALAEIPVENPVFIQFVEL